MLLQVSPNLILNVDEVLIATHHSDTPPSVIIQFRRDVPRVEKHITGADAETAWHRLQLHAARNWPDRIARPTDKQRADLIALLGNALKYGEGERDAAALAEYVLYTLGLAMHPDPQSA
jgi:hypothetical protein